MNTIREPSHRKIIRAIRRNRFKVLAMLLFSLLVTCCAVTRETGRSLSDMPSQQGRIFLVTGGNSGIGYESTNALAARGAQVVIASRNPDRGREDARGGGYYGPAGLAEIRGPAGLAKVPPAAGDAESAARLWTVSEQLTGIHYP